ncbi:hypothetical protein SAMD00019534_106070 [Acytostelium subglobosum LB1]|uniref:hypothetical protein n=1 Tax=Acytostelium subglobosum LB1 TaxID=1410327 RepID=UPI00064504CC|nr:hypothetical protein SAMD00019534_106070 [Acytostelium subglobosum LB1]GAM27431.1 hypothetical protein SAMD00019534_106070 [Acytostelium subglobosum LB1]|eukprot:XP_012749496.1 hypothetical protein SAMD00019534_106070 [Acytostelium subglobosum LB1]
MKYTLLVLCFALMVVLPLASARCASNSLVRKEVRQMTPTELSKYINAVKLLRNLTSPTTPTVTRYDTFAVIHVTQNNRIHSGANFLPWHRYYLKQLELLLQSVTNDPTIYIPYWDWSLDYLNPTASILMTDAYFGGNGGSGGCVTNGQLGKWRPKYNSNGQLVDHCLPRSFGSDMNNYPSPATLNSLIAGSTTFSTLAQNVEVGPHNLVHRSIGGDMTTAISTNDAFFFSHHAMVDRLWANWQDANPALANTYNGRDNTNRRVTLNDVLAGYPGITVTQVMNTTTMGYCYGNAPSTAATFSALSSQTMDAASEEPLPHWPPVSEEYMIAKGIDPVVQAEVTARINSIIDSLNEANGFTVSK